jgi:hypothetical protein
VLDLICVMMLDFQIMLGTSKPSTFSQCFNHVVALVVKIVCQFDISRGDDDKDSEAEKKLQALAEGLDIKDAVTQRELEENDDGTEGWAKERAKLSEADHKAHDDSVRPI